MDAKNKRLNDFVFASDLFRKVRKAELDEDSNK